MKLTLGRVVSEHPAQLEMLILMRRARSEDLQPDDDANHSHNLIECPLGKGSPYHWASPVKGTDGVLEGQARYLA